MFQKAKDAYRLQKQAKEIKKDLKNIHVESEQDGVTITVNAEMEVISVNISDETMQQTTGNKKVLEDRLVKSFNKGLKKAQQIAAEKMKHLMGDFGLPSNG